MLVALTGGCASTARVHESYETLAPEVIDVRRPVNETVRALESVSFGGLAQRLMTGPRSYNVPMLLHHGLCEALEEKGYAVERDLSSSRFPEETFRGPSENQEDVPFDAVLHTTILSWSLASVTTTRVTMRWKVELYRVKSGELLFANETKAYFEDKDPASDGRFLQSGLRRAAARALAALPERKPGGD